MQACPAAGGAPRRRTNSLIASCNDVYSHLTRAQKSSTCRHPFARCPRVPRRVPSAVVPGVRYHEYVSIRVRCGHWPRPVRPGDDMHNRYGRAQMCLRGTRRLRSASPVAVSPRPRRPPHAAPLPRRAAAQPPRPRGSRSFGARLEILVCRLSQMLTWTRYHSQNSFTARA